MPRVKTGLTVSEYAVLGLLSRGPDYGYSLQQYFSAEGALGRVCPVEPAALYAVLKSLSGLELIDGEWDRSQYPPKAVYSISAEGEAVFDRWLLSPVGRIREVRSDFLTKLYFAMQRGRDLAIELIEAQQDICHEYESRYEAELHKAAAGSFEQIFLASKLSAARTTRVWLEESARLLHDAESLHSRQTRSTIR